MPACTLDWSPRLLGWPLAEPGQGCNTQGPLGTRAAEALERMAAPPPISLHSSSGSIYPLSGKRQVITGAEPRQQYQQA